MNEKYTYAAYEKGGEKLCIAMANTAKALGEILGIADKTVFSKVSGRYGNTQSRSPYYVTRMIDDGKPIPKTLDEIQSANCVAPAKKHVAPAAASTASATTATRENEPLSSICKRLRQHMGITQTDFARIIFSTPCEVSLMERGLVPSDDRKSKKIRKIAHKIGMI